MVNLLNDRKRWVTFSIVIILLVSILYFRYSNAMVDPKIYSDMKIKIAFSPGKDIKLFALADPNYLAMIPSKGKSIPTIGSIVLGYEESRMMKKEKLFALEGDSIKNFFGIDARIDGTLQKTRTIIDDMHFLSEKGFDDIEGRQGIVYIRLTEEKMPKIFYYHPMNEKMDYNLSEGTYSDYKIMTADGKTYYPIILGSSEADMMKKEKLISKAGDKIEGFFGKNIFVAGILEKTGSAQDMMHYIPVKESDLK